jgi:hypothetical protein
MFPTIVPIITANRIILIRIVWIVICLDVSSSPSSSSNGVMSVDDDEDDDDDDAISANDGKGAIVPVEYFVKLLNNTLDKRVVVRDVDATRLKSNDSSEKFKLLLIPLIVCLASVKLKMYDIGSISSSIK